MIRPLFCPIPFFIKTFKRHYCCNACRHVGLSKKGEWAVAHDCCTSCGTTKRPHLALGMCRLCYGKKVSYVRRRKAIGKTPGERRRV